MEYQLIRHLQVNFTFFQFLQNFQILIFLVFQLFRISLPLAWPPALSTLSLLDCTSPSASESSAFTWVSRERPRGSPPSPPRQSSRRSKRRFTESSRSTSSQNQEICSTSTSLGSTTNSRSTLYPTPLANGSASASPCSP